MRRQKVKHAQWTSANAMHNYFLTLNVILLH